MIPKQYEWLLKEGAPKMLVEFLKIYGVTEVPGTADNPVILSWAAEIGLQNIYKHDSIAWCGLEMAVIASRAGKEVVKDPLWALNWLKFGVPVTQPMLGDVLVFKRTEGGHVGLYVGEDTYAYHVAGGNESDKSNIVRIPKIRFVGARRPVWKTAQPANVRKIFLTDTGELSKNEA